MDAMAEALLLAQQLRGDSGWRGQALRAYWHLCFTLTRIVERYVGLRAQRIDGRGVMNYGCGNKFYDTAINVDLLAPHRFLLGKRRPDIYWTGTVPLPSIRARMGGIVCEHVIEHILPDGVARLFRNFHHALEPGGLLVVSFPDLHKVMEAGRCQGFESAVASVNALVYRHGHCFMYDSALVMAMLTEAGFVNVRRAQIGALPLQEFISVGRAHESSYVVAECAAASP